MYNYLGGLHRRIDHIKIAGDQEGGYEPTLVIYHDAKKGRSFQIRMEAMWKYVDPMHNKDALQSDIEEFRGIYERSANRIAIMTGVDPEPDLRKKSKLDIAHWAIASTLYKTMGILPCVCYNLVKCLTMFEITVLPESVAQLLLWIQDALDDLKNANELPPEKPVGVEGEVTIFLGSDKLATKELTVTETDLITRGN